MQQTMQNMERFELVIMETNRLKMKKQELNDGGVSGIRPKDLKIIKSMFI